MTNKEITPTPIGLILKRAQSWEEAGKLHQAIGMYFMLMEYHSGTEESQRARERLGGLAQRFEAEGKVHQATHLWNRLTALC